MKRNYPILLLTLSFLIVCFVACEKDKLVINDPVITMSMDSPVEFEEVVFTVEEYAELNYTRVLPEYIKWSIADSLGDIIKNDFSDTVAIKWIPEESGLYNVSVEIGYGADNKIAANQEVNVSETNLRIVASILIENPLPLMVNEQISINANEHAYINNTQRILAKSFSWTIADSVGKAIKDNFDIEASSIKWIPDEVGKFVINLIIDYDKGITKTLSKSIDIVDHCPNYFVQAEFVIENTLPLIVDEELSLYLIENATCNNIRVLPRKYQWTIQDSLGNIVSDDFDNYKGGIKWIFEEVGEYNIIVTIDYQKNIKETINQIVNVTNDFREPYTGDYHFTRNKFTWTENTGTTWKPTSYYDGYVQPDPDNKENIIVRCGPGEFGSWSDYFSIKLYEGNDTLNPRFLMASGHFYVRGDFINTDSLSFKYGDGGRGGGYGWEIFGKKKE